MRPVVQLTPGITRLVVNQRKEYLQDKRVRQALSYAIDRDHPQRTRVSGAWRTYLFRNLYATVGQPRYRHL